MYGENIIMTKNDFKLTTVTNGKAEIEALSRALASKISMLRKAGLSLTVILEGLDASGKSGCAKRISEFMSDSEFNVVHISAPTEEEKSHVWLWRFWRDIPAVGKIAVFDRSWYGRVLVERVEKLCTEDDWRRAYSEINDFEKYITSNGSLLMKFWLDVSAEEQLKRFSERAADPKKAYKITDEDWRNRAKRKDYDNAVSDMIRTCDKDLARWYVIPANNKKNARATVLRTIINEIEKKVSGSRQKPQ